MTGRPKHLEVQVPIAGASPFGLALDGVPVEVELTNQEATLHVLGPLAFTAVVPPRELPLRVRRTWQGDERFLTLAPSSRLLFQKVVEDAMAAVTVDLESDLELPPVRAKCVDLTLGDTLAPPPTHRVPPRALRMTPVGETLALRRAPDPTAAAWTITAHKGSAFELTRLATRGPWVELSAAWSDGTRLRGWAAASEVQWFDGELLDQLGTGGLGLCGAGWCGGYHGPAVLHGGASVHASPDGPVWARAARSVAIVVFGNADWVEVDTIPGLASSNSCGRIDHAYVRAEDLTFPH